MKLEDFIDKNEISCPRTPCEFVDWFERKLNITKEFKDELKKQCRLHIGIAKVFYEELFPLYCLLQNRIKEWGHAKFIPIIGSQNFDVEVIGADTNIPKYIEITTTSMNECERARMEYFLQHGSVDTLGVVTIKRGSQRCITVANGLVQVDEANQAQKNRIRTAIERKLKVIDRNPQTALLVYFDDYSYLRFDDEKSGRPMNGFFDTPPISWASKYESIYIVGSSGRSVWANAATSALVKTN